MIVIEIPGLRLVSEGNARENHFAKAKRVREQKQIVAAFFRVKRPERPPFPLVVTITRLGPRALDSDNLAGSGKHVRDSVASWLGVDDGVAERTLIDGLPQVEWRVEAEKSRTYGVRIGVQTAWHNGEAVA